MAVIVEVDRSRAGVDRAAGGKLTRGPLPDWDGLRDIARGRVSAGATAHAGVEADVGRRSPACELRPVVGSGHDVARGRAPVMGERSWARGPELVGGDEERGIACERVPAEA